MANSNQYTLLFESWRAYIKESEELSAELEAEKTNEIQKLIKNKNTAEQIFNALSNLPDYSYLKNLNKNNKEETTKKIRAALISYNKKETSLEDTINSISVAAIQAHSGTLAAAPKEYEPLPHIPGVHPATDAELLRFMAGYAMLASLPILFDIIMSILKNMGPLEIAATAAIIAVINDPVAFTKWLACVTGSTTTGAVDTVSSAIAKGLKKLYEMVTNGGTLGKTKAEDVQVSTAAGNMITSIIKCFGIPLTKKQQEEAAKKAGKDPTFIDKAKQTVDDILSWFKDKEGSGSASDDEEALMRMLFAETSYKRSEREMAAIIQVAINRKIKRNKQGLVDIVRPKNSGWNDASDTYKNNYNNAHKYFDIPTGQIARRLIKRMLKGQSPVGTLNGAQNWLHAAGMPKCNKQHGTPVARGRYCFDYGELGWNSIGKRVVPDWAIQNGNGKGQLPVGTSKSMPVKIDGMVYCQEDQEVAKKLAQSPSIINSQGKKDITIIGDSLMPTSTRGIGHYIEKQFQGRVSNLSIPGQPMHGSSKNAIRKQYNRIPKSTKILIVNGGVNDTYGHQYREPKENIENIVKAYEEIIQDAKSKGIKVIIFPIVVPYKRKLPVKPNSSHRNSKPTEDSRAVNKRLKSMANGNDVIYIGGFEEISVKEKRRNLHPAPHYRKIAAAINNKIKEIEK